ncbi:hypothetical protein FIM62_07845 [Helicobacter pylori]|nr:hypothetical protein FIM86_07915 [Helicobacter pylori]TPH63736.1 hypothetical protein FIM62_07845 [Helicobacter pylori]TPH92538.1 hypothetical protein FIM45_08195 [Helicobacter pylori]
MLSFEGLDLFFLLSYLLSLLFLFVGFGLIDFNRLFLVFTAYGFCCFALFFLCFGCLLFAL